MNYSRTILWSPNSNKTILLSKIHDRKNRLYLFSFDFPPNTGGIARLCDEIARGLNKRGFDVKVLTQKRLTPFPSENHPIPIIRVIPRRPLREVAALRVLFARRQTSCISGIWYPEGVLAQFAGIQSRVILALGAELYLPQKQPRRAIWKHLLRYSLESADCVIAISHFTSKRVLAMAPKAHVITLPLGVDTRHFKPHDRNDARAHWQISNDKRVLCSVSRIHRFKGHETILKALSQLPRAVKQNFIYLIAGIGPDQSFLKSLAEKLEVTDQIRWLDFVSEDDLPSLYSAADLFVLMTREEPEARSVEGFGLVFLEAQACGTPVIGTRTGGIPDAIIVDNGGWLIEQDDDASLLQFLLRLNEEPQLFRDMGLKARLRIEQECSWEHYIDQFISALTEVGIHLDIR